VYRILVETARDTGDTGPDDYYGHGLVDAAGALAYLVQAYEDYPVRPTARSASAAAATSEPPGGYPGAGGSASAAVPIPTSAAAGGPRGRSLSGLRGALTPAAELDAGIDYDGGRVLLALREAGISPRELADVRSRLAAEIPGVAEISGDDPRRLQAILASGVAPRDAIAALGADSRVDYAQPNYFYTLP
jgi:hypothetical protein